MATRFLLLSCNTFCCTWDRGHILFLQASFLNQWRSRGETALRESSQHFLLTHFLGILLSRKDDYVFAFYLPVVLFLLDLVAGT